MTGSGNLKCTYASSAQRCVWSDFWNLCVVIYYQAVVTAVSNSCFGKNMKLIQHVNFKEKTWENKAKNNTHQNHGLSLSVSRQSSIREKQMAMKFPEVASSFKVLMCLKTYCCNIHPPYQVLLLLWQSYIYIKHPLPDLSNWSGLKPCLYFRLTPHCKPPTILWNDRMWLGSPLNHQEAATRSKVHTWRCLFLLHST